MNKSTWKLVIAIVVVLALFPLLPYVLRQDPVTSAPAQVQEQAVPPPLVQPSLPPVYAPAPAVPRSSSGVIENAFQNHASNLPVVETGAVSRILSDDNKGDRHQRFIVSLPSGHTVLIAYNIDIAPRISNLREGDPITFSGVYEWNAQGGVVHWTHHDPSGRHPSGYLQHNGKSYQ